MAQAADSTPEIRYKQTQRQRVSPGYIHISFRILSSGPLTKSSKRLNLLLRGTNSMVALYVKWNKLSTMALRMEHAIR